MKNKSQAVFSLLTKINRHGRLVSMKLQDYLTQKKMSLSDFSRKSKIPIPNIWRYVRDRRPSLLNVRLIKEATNGKVTEKDFP